MFRMRRTTLTTRIAVMTLIVTLSSCVCREYTLFVSGWCGRVNGGNIIKSHYKSRLSTATIQSSSVCKSSRQFHKHKPGNQLRLPATAFQIEGTRNFNRVYRDRKTPQSGIRNLSSNLKAEHNEEFDHACNSSYEHKNKNKSSRNKSSAEASSITPPADVSARETVGSVLGIDPEIVDIYERTDERRTQQQIENELDNMGFLANDLNSPFSNRNFIEMFRGSANYIASHRNTLAVFHIPGDLMDENPKGFRDLMDDISLSWLLGMKIVIVAGCRYQIDKRCKEDSQGRREHMGMVVTDKESLRIVKEEAGYVRFEVERQLARALKGGSSWGTSRSSSNGTDDDDVGEGNVVSGNFYSAQPFGVLDGVDYEYSGFVRRMETKKIHQVHQNRDIVLLTSLGFSPTGEVFNVNSEYLASYAAGELFKHNIYVYMYIYIYIILLRGTRLSLLIYSLVVILYHTCNSSSSSVYFRESWC
jgi:acetylglutamate kinase